MSEISNFTIKTFPGGERVGIVGRTGAGKSSLLLALFLVVVCALVLRAGASLAAAGRRRLGAGPERGHSNVQGDRTMGIHAKPPAAFLDRLGEVFGFEPPRAHGVDTVGAIEAMLAGRGKVVIAMGGKFAAATPATRHLSARLQRVAVLVHRLTPCPRL